MSIGAHQLAIEWARSGRLAEAEELLRFLLRSTPDPNIRTDLALVVLSQGRYPEGAALYESRLAAASAPPDPRLPFPRWRGEDLSGKRVLVWPEQGLGDQIMYARFAPALQARGCDVTLVCRPPLHGILARSLGARVLPAEGSIDFPDPDVWLWSSSLLLASAATLETVPAEPYLKAPAAVRVAGHIGVVTRGSPTNTNDHNRSLPEDAARALLALPGAISLKPEDTGARTFDETAAIVAGLDLVITVDTSVAHLAGAMGKPVWVLLPAIGTDWRWLRDRPDTPWYPSARLFRQDRPGDWAGVLDRVGTALRRLPGRL